MSVCVSGSTVVHPVSVSQWDSNGIQSRRSTIYPRGVRSSRFSGNRPRSHVLSARCPPSREANLPREKPRTVRFTVIVVIKKRVFLFFIYGENDEEFIGDFYPKIDFYYRLLGISADMRSLSKISKKERISADIPRRQYPNIHSRERERERELFARTLTAHK